MSNWRIPDPHIEKLVHQAHQRFNFDDVDVEVCRTTNTLTVYLLFAVPNENDKVSQAQQCARSIDNSRKYEGTVNSSISSRQEYVSEVKIEKFK